MMVTLVVSVPAPPSPTNLNNNPLPDYTGNQGFFNPPWAWPQWNPFVWPWSQPQFPYVALPTLPDFGNFASAINRYVQANINQANPYGPGKNFTDPCPNAKLKMLHVINNIRIVNCDGKVFVNEHELNSGYSNNLNVTFDNTGKLVVNNALVPQEYYSQ